MRTYYASAIGSLRKDLQNKKHLKVKVKQLSEQLCTHQKEYMNLLEAQKLLSTVSDDNTEATLNFITGVVNKALGEIFKGDTRRIYLKKTLYAGCKPHITVKLVNGKGESVDMALQSGTGLRQIVSILFIICLIEIRKGRRFLVLDEKLSGLHYEAKRILSEILKIFAEGGFQFLFVEYGLDGLGKIYNVEKPKDEAKIYSLEGMDYKATDVFLFSGDADLSLLDEGFVEESEGEILSEGTIGL